MRWLRRLGRVVTVLFTLGGVVASAGALTWRQRHHAERQSAPRSAPEPAEPATVADIQPEEIHVEGVEIHIPAPSVWPVILAFGLMLVFFGVVTNLGFAIVGGVLLIWAVGGWLKELHRG